MVLCLTITLFLPLVTYLAVDRVEERLYARSSATPILVGSKGSPFLLTFNAIYFKTPPRGAPPPGRLPPGQEAG